MRNKLLLILILLLPCGLYAAAPNTLSYQGNLANASGQPITATLNITFRLFDVASGGTVLWSETQPAVSVDGGNLAVELGLVTPLPTAIWGRQLYLGIQIAGDSEMTPRPRLTAAPFALRAGSTMARTVVVSADRGELENGDALLAAIAALPSTTAANPWTVEVDAGSYNLDNNMLLLPSHVTLRGRGMDATRISSTAFPATILMASNSHLQGLTARNNGLVSGNNGAYGIGAHAFGDPIGPVSGVSLTQVRGESIAPTHIDGGSRPAIYLCATDSFLRQVEAISSGGAFSMGLRADCQASDGNMYDGLQLRASGGGLGQRGAYLSGGGLWSNITAIVGMSGDTVSAYGIRVFDIPRPNGAVLRNSSLVIEGSSQPSTVVNSVAETLRIDAADVIVRDVSVIIVDVNAQNIAGIRTTASSPDKPADLHGVDVEVRGAQQGSLGPGAVYGLRLQNQARVSHSRISVRCVPPSDNQCFGVHRINTNLPLELDQIAVDVSSDDPVNPGIHKSVGAELGGEVRVYGSTFRVLRSPDNEAALALDINGTSRVYQSTLIVDSVSNPNGNCAVSGTGGSVAEFLNNTFQGNVCSGLLASTCAGNTRRGSGFLASTCP